MGGSRNLGWGDEILKSYYNNSNWIEWEFTQLEEMPILIYDGMAFVREWTIPSQRYNQMHFCSIPTPSFQTNDTLGGFPVEICCVCNRIVN